MQFETLKTIRFIPCKSRRTNVKKSSYYETSKNIIREIVMLDK